MKAYVVRIEGEPDCGNEIVFAKNTKEAIKLARKTKLSEEADSFIDVRVSRNNNFDGMESYSEEKLACEQWKQGWWFFQDGCPSCEESTKKDFYKWYEDTYKIEVSE